MGMPGTSDLVYRGPAVGTPEWQARMQNAVFDYTNPEHLKMLECVLLAASAEGEADTSKEEGKDKGKDSDKGKDKDDDKNKKDIKLPHELPTWVGVLKTILDAFLPAPGLGSADVVIELGEAMPKAVEYKYKLEGELIKGGILEGPNSTENAYNLTHGKSKDQ